ncbi:NAD(P)/FAD-dependent oxidoreductase [Mycobacterium sp. 94-17]|uniref:flavin-containing monooxygenase n=1 Tax=Mycobacterium sp. 94-17 TaxID=2986147 RepID=UPI002D1E8580|nr:NAD(P)/FAD-dependent oxidoreductase [Mycobacterium sp. 94-17]MEB4209786.1 NAD(P)/FAD-dependent oxidoreductase [Mycobacterium sp. 94-17]
MTQSHTAPTVASEQGELRRLTGLPFNDSDEVIRAAIEEASVPALLMSMVHMTGDMGLLEELPGPFMLLAMDKQGAMSEADKETVRARAFDVIRQYRDRGCPVPFAPDETQMRSMLNTITVSDVADEYIDYIAADLRFSSADQAGPVLTSTTDQRNAFPVVVVGCGEAGILAGIKLKQAGIPFTIVEKQSGAGGTWLTNRYPGCRVDISNHYYTYSFEPTDHWSHSFSEQPEILRYLNEVMDRYDIRSHVRFDTEVTAATWNDDTATWQIEIGRADRDGDGDTLTARALICAVGLFSNSVIPHIDGASDFAGPAFHTAAWDDSVDLAGKRVAVIGAGASGFQLVPAIASIAEQVDVYQRTAQWMAPNVGYHDPIGAGEKWALRHLPYYARWQRFISWWPITDAAHDMVIIDPEWDNGGLSCSEPNNLVRELWIAWMQAFTNDEALLEKITPDYPPMGKRTLQDNGTWIVTLQRDDVELIRDRITGITQTGVTTADGTHRPADVLVWATGFDVNHQLGPINVCGLGGRELNDVWGDAAYAYLGITVPEFPNFFTMYGPGTNAANGASIIYNSECQMRYIMGCIDLILAGDGRSLMPKADVCDDYNRRSIEKLQTMVYTHPAVNSYYKNSAGTVPSLYAWRIVDYWNWTNRPNPQDFELRP